MIDEEKLEELRRNTPPGNDCSFCVSHRGDMENTLLDLWRIARAARRWTKAMPGWHASEAEAVLVEELEAIKGTKEPRGERVEVEVPGHAEGAD